MRLLLGLLVLAGVAVVAVRFEAGGAPLDRPHVVVICVDGCRADHLGCYGYGRDTSPNLDRLAREGVRFARNQCQANESLFSHSSLFTSRYPSELGPLSYTRFTLREDVPYLPRILKARGYATGAFTGGGHVDGRYGFAHGFDRYFDEVPFGEFHDSVPEALAWAAERKKEPLFLFLHGYDCHRPYRKRGIFHHLFDPDYRGDADFFLRANAILDRVYDGAYYRDFVPSYTWTAVGHLPSDPRDYLRLGQAARSGSLEGFPLSKADIDHLRAHYDGAVGHADLWVGYALASLRGLGFTERNTVVIVVADHGEDLMEHGVFNHRIGLQQANIHTPLIVWGWGVHEERRGAVVDGITQNLDVVPTLLALLDIAPPGPDLRGRDLSPWLRPSPPELPERPAFAEGILGMTTIVDRRYSLTGFGAPPGTPGMVRLLEAGRLQFFDRETDPGEHRDRAADPALEAPRESLRARLLEKERMVAEERPIPQGKPGLDPELRRILEEHGYW